MEGGDPRDKKRVCAEREQGSPPPPAPTLGEKGRNRAAVIGRRFHVIALAAMVVLAGSIYGNALHAPFQFDDRENISKVRTFDHIRRALEQPTLYKHRLVPYVTLAVDYRLWGNSTFGYHLFNVIVHVLNAFLVYLIAIRVLACGGTRKDREGAAGGEDEVCPAGSSSHLGSLSLSGPRDEQSRHILGLMVGLLFLAHPLQTNAVTYIVQRMVALVTLFYLGSFYAFVRAHPVDGKTGALSKGLLLLVSVVSFCLALWSKEIAVTLPGMIVVYYVLFVMENRRRALLKGVLHLAPVILLLGVIGYSYLYHQMGTLPAWSEPSGGHDWGMKHSLYTQVYVVVEYLKLLAFPLPRLMNVDHDIPVAQTFWQISTFGSALILIGVLLAGLWLVRRSKVMAFGIFWFFIALIPSSSVWPIWDRMVEYRTYLPGFGFHLVLGMAMYLIGGLVVAQTGARKGWIWAPLAAIVIMYAAGTIERNKVFNDVYGLWKDAVAKSPDKWRPHNNLADMYEQVGRHEEAIREYHAILELNPNVMRAHYGLGNVYRAMGKPERAISAYTRAIAVDSTFALAHNNLGIVYYESGRPELAEEEYSQAVTCEPEFVNPYNNLAVIYAEWGEYDRAIETIQQALRVDPKYAIGLQTLGRLHVLKGDSKQANPGSGRAAEARSWPRGGGTSRENAHRAD